MESHRDSVLGNGIGLGLKSYFTDAKIWHLHLGMFLTHKQCVVETEEMSVVETEQMSAAEIKQLPPTPTPPAAPSAWILPQLGWWVAIVSFQQQTFVLSRQQTSLLSPWRTFKKTQFWQIAGHDQNNHRGPFSGVKTTTANRAPDPNLRSWTPPRAQTYDCEPRSGPNSTTA